MTLVIIVQELNGSPMVKVGLDNGFRAVAFNEAEDVNGVIDDLADHVKRVYQVPQRSESRSIGFRA